MPSRRVKKGGGGAGPEDRKKKKKVEVTRVGKKRKDHVISVKGAVSPFPQRGGNKGGGGKRSGEGRKNSCAWWKITKRVVLHVERGLKSTLPLGREKKAKRD